MSTWMRLFVWSSLWHVQSSASSRWFLLRGLSRLVLVVWLVSVQVGLYFRRRQALCRALTRLSNARESVSGVPVYTSHAGISASTRARKRGAAQDATKFNSAELSRFTPAIQPIMYRCQELSLQRIELAITSVSSLLGNQLVASGSQRACGHGQRTVATPRVKLSFSFLSPFSIHWIDFILIDS